MLCVLDKEPRHLSAEQLEGLRLLARQTAFVLEFRRRTMEQNDIRSEAGPKETSPLSLAERSGRQEALRFARAVIEALPLQFCVLDKNGRILEMNRQWQEHERDSGYWNRGGKAFAKGLRAVLSGKKEDFSLAYQDWNARAVPQWFIGKVMPFPDQELASIIAAHENITDLKLLEHRFRQLVESSSRPGTSSTA